VSEVDPALSRAEREALAELALRLGDDRLILGHRLSEWCGHAPVLEEELALANVALDCLGHASTLLALAGELEGRGRSADELAFLRDAREFRNCLLVEQPNGDFAVTMVRQLLFDQADLLFYEGLQASRHAGLAGFAARAVREIRYHVRHARAWWLRLGDGTDESRRRMEAALEELWRFTGELFATDELERGLAAAGLAPDRAALASRWEEALRAVAAGARLRLPGAGPLHAGGGRRGIHGESLGLLLAEMQVLARTHPGASW